MKIRNIFLAGAMTLALIGCGGNSNPVQTTTQQICADGQQPLPLANGGLICPSGQQPTAQTVVVQPQQNSFWEDMFMYHLLFGGPSYGPGWFGGSQYYNRTTVHNHYYNYGPHGYGEAPRNYTSVPPRASANSNSGLNIYSSKPNTPSSSFGAFSGKTGSGSSFSNMTKPSTGSSFDHFSSDSSHSFTPSTRSFGSSSSNNSSSFKSFGGSSSGRSFGGGSSFGGGGRSFGRGR